MLGTLWYYTSQQAFYYSLFVCFSRGCSAEQELFQTLALNVNKYLRVKVEAGVDKNTMLGMQNYFESEEIDLFAKLATNETQTKIILDAMWKEFGNYTDKQTWEIQSMITDQLTTELNDTTEECSENDDCWMMVEKIVRSIYTLTRLATEPPKSPGHYIAYHIDRIFGPNSYLSQNQRWPKGASKPFKKQPSELTLLFDNYLMDITSELSHGKLKKISILDLPAFGFMSDDFQANCFEMPWPIQINMATYHQFLSANWSTNWNRKIITECKGLSMNWRDYVRESNPESGKYPPILRKNTFFNFTEHIKKDMPSYLASYAASFQTISNPNINATMWNEVARRVFLKTNPNDFMKSNGYYDKLIIDCAFKEPLMRHKPDMAEGCLDFYHSLTSNGLCYTFNGIDSSDIWKDAEIIQAFNKIFGQQKNEEKKFRGIGQSEGKAHSIL